MAKLTLLLVLGTFPALAGTLTVQTNAPGPTPDVLGYDLGHFYPGSNTPEWWRYAGVNGARIFISASQIESSSVIAGAAALAGVSNRTSFLICRAAMHTNQFSPAYINWSNITNHYLSNDLYPVNHIVVSPAIAALRNLGVQICAQITVSPSVFPIADTNDWAGMWGLWHHYYAEAFYLGRYYDVQRYQMYNEPNLASLTPADFQFRLQLAADALAAALADVNALYGKSLSPLMLAPVLAGGATGHFADWGLGVVTNRHLNFLGQSDTNYLAFQKYDYHEYDSSPSSFGTHLASLNSSLQSAMAPEPAFATTVSEFNTHTAANFDALTNTLDTPSEYSRLAAILVELMANHISELYCFKFSQVGYAGSYPVQKNALHYVDNTNAPFNVGGVTKAGEAFRLFNQAFAAGRSRRSVSPDAGAASLETAASFDSARQRYYLYCVNNTAGSVPLNLNLAAWHIPTANAVLLEEVSETDYGAGSLWTNLPAASVLGATQPANSVWLLTVPARAQQAEQLVAATEDAEVRDGGNRGSNYGAAAAMTVRNDPADAANRRAALIKFHLPTNPNNLEFALLSLRAGCATSNCTAQAWVYLLTDTNWSQSTVTWSTVPNLRQNGAAGSNIANSVVQGLGTNASIAGQIVVTSVNASEKLVNLTDLLRGQTNVDFSLLILQEPRWDLSLPTLVPGDTQPDGLQLSTTESGNGPRLRLVLAAVQPPQITSITASPGGGVALGFLGTPAGSYVLQAATNLTGAPWLPVSTNTADSAGHWTFGDFTTNRPAQFYRVQPQF